MDLLEQNDNLTVESQLELIKENLAEIIGEKELIEKLNSGKTLKIYWGTSPTGKPHIGYFLPLIKIAQLVKAGCIVTVLFADLHAYLDAMKTTWELLEFRTQYYEQLIKSILLQLGVDLDRIKFIKGSHYQLTTDYTIDVYKFMSKITVDSAQKGGAEVVKQSDNPLLSGLAYPILQVLDEVYLDADAELGGQDQRKIFMMSRDHIHKLGYTPAIHLMNPMIPSITAKNINGDDEANLDDIVKPEQIDKYIEQINRLKTKNLSWDNFIKINEKISTDLKNKYVKKTESNKMSSSDSNSKIEFLEEPSSIRKKISKAFAEPTNTSNTLFLFLQYVIFPINKLKSMGKFIINRDEKYGGVLEYSDLESIKADYSENNLAPQDLKQGISDWLINFLTPVKNSLNTDEFNELVKKAYP
jgi:tyrosyl-tRNA synthetase